MKRVIVGIPTNAKPYVFFKKAIKTFFWTHNFHLLVPVSP